ncbi:MAG: hypothetical protein ACJ8R9_10755 [Steroidobacteraceae bacterium]
MSKTIKDDLHANEMTPAQRYYHRNKHKPEVRAKHNERSNRIQKRHWAKRNPKIIATARRYLKSEKYKAWHEATREHRREVQRQWRRDNPYAVSYKDNPKYRAQRFEISERWRTNNPLKSLLVQAKSRAKREGIPFDIVVEDLVVPEYCPIVGLKMAGSRQGDMAPSLDRIIPKLGYVKGNVKVVSRRGNRLKSDHDLETLQRVRDYILESTNEVSQSSGIDKKA